MITSPVLELVLEVTFSEYRCRNISMVAHTNNCDEFANCSLCVFYVSTILHLVKAIRYLTLQIGNTSASTHAHIICRPFLKE